MDGDYNMYTTTALEDWVTSMYARMRIQDPADIDIKYLSYRFSIFIHYKPMPARYDIYGRYRAIVLDDRCTLVEQREQFFHEYCHILRHSGHQTMMPKAYRELQEWDANQFVMYAALPSFLLKSYDFDDPMLVQYLADDFKVTEDLCVKRLEQIKRKQMNDLLVAEKEHVYTTSKG